jgi:PKD repeat protein
VTSLLADSGSTVNSGSYGGLTATTNAPSGKGASWTIILAPAGTTNAPPQASFTVACTGLQCNVDGSGSSDPDGTVTSYAWNFGDGTTVPASSSATASHTYAASGSYSITLTVTDNGGAIGTKTITKSVAPGGQAIGFDGANSVDTGGPSSAVTVPASAAAGDTLLLFDSIASTSITASPPSGWTLVGSTNRSNLTTAVYEKTASASDPGSSVSITYTGGVKASLTVAAYSNTGASPIEAAQSATSLSTTSHATPALSGLTAGTWVVTCWTDKSTTTSSWTLPAGVTQRAVVYGSGSAADSAVLADTGGAVSGTFPAQTATTNVASGSAAQWAVALSPGA